MLQFCAQMNCTARDIKRPAPVCEASFFDDYLMTAGSDGDRRGRVTDKRSVDFDVRVGDT